ncbi:MAG: GntR family transcriptional regulator [Microbacteriaceae bacterium]|nr:GntR family transcriptional regulator [Microbacteriaceae bacterium]
MDFDTGSPIWAQLVAEFTRRIVTGEWPAGARIPAVRDIATEVGVNPNTAQRALAELERLELCRSERTAGRFVTDDPERIDALRTELARDAALAYIRTARGLGMTLPRARDLIEKGWRDHDHHDRTDDGGDDA